MISLLQSTTRIDVEFKKILGVTAAYSDDEIYVNTSTDASQNAANQYKKFKAKHKFQRDLIVNYFNLVMDVSKDSANEIKIKRSVLNLISDDIIVPPKAILSYKIQIKIKGQIYDADFTLGVNNIVVHQWAEQSKINPNLKSSKQIAMSEKCSNLIIHNIIPFNYKYFYIDSNCEPNQLICKHANEVISFFFKSELEASNMKEALKAIYHNKIFNDQIYIHIPDLKKINKDNLSYISQRFIKEKSKQITQKIDHHKFILSLLLKARYQLDVQGERVDYDFQEDQGLYNTAENGSLNQNQNESDENTYDPDNN